MEQFYAYPLGRIRALPLPKLLTTVFATGQATKLSKEETQPAYPDYALRICSCRTMQERVEFQYPVRM